MVLRDTTIHSDVVHLHKSQPGASLPRAKSRLARLASEEMIWLGAFCLHIPLGLLLAESSMLSTLHALGVALLGLGVLFLDADRDRAERRIVLVAAYIVGAEILWRMTGARVFWEYGKYLMVLMLGLALLRRPGALRLHPLPLLFLLLLLPSTAMLAGESFGQIRDQLSFNLSGPLALVVAVLFFIDYRLDDRWRTRVLLALATPVISIAAVTLYGILTTPVITFATEANFAASGGFGPNQVSSILGLGIVACWFIMLDNRLSPKLRLVVLGMAMWFLTQALLTFSRSGAYGAALALAASLPFLFVTQGAGPRSLARWLLMLGVLGLLVQYLLIPRIDAYTSGFFSLRYGNLDSTGRVELSQEQWELWQEQPLTGVGPGESGEAGRKVFGRAVASHTEIIRLPAEHGFLGLIALLMLAVGGIGAFARAAPGVHRAFVVACIAWVFLYLLTNAMRSVAPSFIYGLAFAVSVTTAGRFEHE